MVRLPSDTIRLGTSQTRTFIAGISGATVTGTPVVVNANGQLGGAPSSQRFKDEIKSMDNTSEAILALKPVTFRYKKDIDPDGIPQFGLVAEDNEKVNPDLEVRDKEGKPYTVRYEAVNAMLLNEFLKEHRKVKEQEATIAQLKKDFRTTVAQLTARLEAQEAQLQKVNASSKRTSRHRKSSLIISEAHYCCALHSFRSASLNAMVRSSLPVESKTRISPERNLARH
jgi:predicted ribosome quality control (RQC) complex YloA/Tae2 family protein